jgi:hypothetical protein
MDFNTTIDIILNDLREVREIIDDLRNYPGLPVLQIELAKSKCRSAEEVITLLKTLKPAITESVASTVETTPSEPVPEKPVTHMVTTVEEIGQKQVTVTEISENRTVQKTQATEIKSSSKIMADNFAGQSGTISDKFVSANKGEDLASKIKKGKHISDLSDAIGISDKFLFINEIFKGNKSEYEQAIEKLNRAGNIPDARAIIMSYTGENEENEVVLQLIEIVKRKLPSDG